MKNKILEKKAIKWCNTYYECDDYIILNCSKEETNESYDVLIDKEDFELVSKHTWHNKKRKLKNGYIFPMISAKIENNEYLIHQLILNMRGQGNGNIVIDHIDGNRLNNRKSNLRITSQKNNTLNKKIKGYNKNKDNRFIVRITINDTRIFLGTCKTEEEAKILYLKGCLLGRLDQISSYIKEEIKKLNIKITKQEIIDNKWLYKVYCLSNNLKYDLNDKKIECVTDKNYEFIF